MGSILRALRERRGLTVAEAAGWLGLTRATIYTWEGDAKKPDPASLRAAMDLYGATAEERDEVARLRAFGPDSPPAGAP